MAGQVYLITGKPEIDPFKGVLTDNPMSQGNFRHFHQMPTYGYDVARKKFKDFQTLNYENKNSQIYKPIRNFESIKIKRKRRVLGQDFGLPTGVTAQLPVSISDETKLNLLKLNPNIRRGYLNSTVSRRFFNFHSAF